MSNGNSMSTNTVVKPSGSAMRSEYSRVAFAALDNLIDNHYIHSMTRENTMTLAEHLAALNAEKLAWIAEDPDNRWTGLYVEDLDHWAEYGVYTVAQFQRYELESMVWEMYKDVTGFRPRHLDFKSMSDEELNDLTDYLGRQMEAAIEADAQWEREMEEMREHDAAEHAAWLAEQPEAIDYVACHYQEGWL
jgi:hypothetical protein